MQLLSITGEINVGPVGTPVRLGHVIPISRDLNKDKRDPWPDGKSPTWETITRELAMSRSALYLRNTRDHKEYMDFLSGRFVVRCNISPSRRSGRPIMWLNGIRYATGRDRKTFVARGGIVQMGGIQLGDLSALNLTTDVEDCVESLLTSLPNTASAHETPEEPDTESAQPLLAPESELLESLDLFVAAEHELEQLAVAKEGQYAYFSLRSEPTRRRFQIRLQLAVPVADGQRLTAQQPPVELIAITDEAGEPVVLGIEGIEAGEAQYTLTATCSQQQGRLALPPNGTFTRATMDVLLRIRRDAIGKLRDRSAANPWLVSVAAGTASLSDLPVARQDYGEDFARLNASQQDAVSRGMVTPDLMLVLGPPGTGKTTVIYNWVRQFVHAGQRVLITSQNNKAVDNVLERLRRDESLTCVRLGDEKRVSSTLSDLLIDNRAVELQRQLLAGSATSLAALTALGERIAEGLRLGEDASTALAAAEVDAATAPAAAVISGAMREALRQAETASRAHTVTLEAVATRLAALDARTGFARLLSTPWRWWLQRKHTRASARLAAADVATHGLRADLCSRLHAIRATILDWRNALDDCRQQDLYPLLIDLVDVVGATCIGVNTNRHFRDVGFDVAIVDESGQIQLHNLVVPLSKAGRVILVGDHKQLPPVVQDELKQEVEQRAEVLPFDPDKSLLDKSWFEHAWESLPASRRAMLDTQFRCPAVISDFISEAFYEGRYFAGEPMKAKRPISPAFPCSMVFVDTSDQSPMDRSERTRQSGDRNEVMGNRAETELVAELMRYFCRCHADIAEAGEIGVIVPYKNHVAEIQRRLEQDRLKGRLRGLKTPLAELVASVDSYQGQERDIIVFAFSRSNTAGAVGFLADWRRLNVAMTRTKQQLVMVGDLSTLCRPTRRMGPDAEFKHAMQLLQSHLRRRAAIIPSRQLAGRLS